MRDWIFPSVAFGIFLYGAFLTSLYVYKYSTSDATTIYQQAKPSENIGVDGLLEGISKGFTKN